MYLDDVITVAGLFRRYVFPFAFIAAKFFSSLGPYFTLIKNPMSEITHAYGRGLYCALNNRISLQN